MVSGLACHTTQEDDQDSFGEDDDKIEEGFEVEPGKLHELE